MHFRRVSTQLGTNESTYFMVNQMYRIHNSIYIILLYICICVCIRNEQPKALILGSNRNGCMPNSRLVTLDLPDSTCCKKKRTPSTSSSLSLFPSFSPFVQTYLFFLLPFILPLQHDADNATGKKQKENHGTRDSHVVPHRGTNRALFSLTSWIGRGRVLYEGYGRG